MTTTADLSVNAYASGSNYANVDDAILGSVEITPAMAAAATRVIVTNARSAGERRELLEALGLEAS